MSNEAKSSARMIKVAELKPNPENPRLKFNQEEMDVLMESIIDQGILVPLIVYQENKQEFVILDGERRYRCALKLNMNEVPANVIPKPSGIENVLMMFNIHNVREEWELMPTALSLKKVINELGKTNERELAKLTSLSISLVRQCKLLLELPEEYQRMIYNDEIKANYFIEMIPVVRKIGKTYPKLGEKYTEKDLTDIFVEKRKQNIIKNPLEFRELKRVISRLNKGASKVKGEEIVTSLVTNEKYGIADATDESTKMAIKNSKILDLISKLSDSLSQIDIEVKDKIQNVALRDELLALRKKIDNILSRS